MIELRSLGIYLLLLYAAYNAINILYLYYDYSTLFLLIGMAALYVALRTLRFIGKNGGLSQPEIFGGSLLLLMLFVVLLQNIFHQPFVSKDGIEVVSNITSLTLVSFLWFFIGGACSSFEIKQSNVIAVLISVAVALAMFFATDDNLTIPFYNIQIESGVESVNHLILEKHVVILLVFAYALSTNMKYVCVAIGACALFFMGGRTSLFVFLIVAVLMAVRGNLLVNILSIAFLTVLGVVLFQYGVHAGYIDIDAKAVREILFLDGVEEDSSFQGRVELYRQSLPLLADQLWIGHYSLAVERNGNFAGYIHNLLSAWQFYGIFVFIAIIASLIYCLRRMIFSLNNGGSAADSFGSFLIVYVLVSVILSKYVAWHLLWFTLGFWMLRKPARRPSRRRRRSRRSRDLIGDTHMV